jgi:hypothetical protein
MSSSTMQSSVMGCLRPLAFLEITLKILLDITQENHLLNYVNWSIKKCSVFFSTVNKKKDLMDDPATKYLLLGCVEISRWKNSPTTTALFKLFILFYIGLMYIHMVFYYNTVADIAVIIVQLVAVFGN